MNLKEKKKKKKTSLNLPQIPKQEILAEVTKLYHNQIPQNQ